MPYSQYLKILLLFIFTFVTGFAWSQDPHNHHEHLSNEISLGIGATYNLEHDDWGTSLHLHYARKFNSHSNWSYIAGMEYIMADENHYTVEAGLSYLFFNRLSAGMLPGVTFANNKSDMHEGEHNEKVFPSVHFELMYGLFHFKKFHLGPVIDYTLSKHESHLTFGIHTAICF